VDSKPAIFIVYIWRLPEGFKASARVADSEETLQFEHPTELLHYLVGLPPAESGRPGKGGELTCFDK
jgi:hypothetical protein